MVKATFTTAAILGLLTGSVWGYYTARELSGTMELVDATSVSQVTSHFSTEQFERADIDHARTAVLSEINVLEQFELATNEMTYRGQLGYAYARLGTIEESAKHPDAARQAFLQARSWFKRGFGHDLTDDQMKEALRRMDHAFDQL
ncbi:MAG: hypothetical protein WB952_12535 [Terriglobales bacterium]